MTASIAAGITAAVVPTTTAYLVVAAVLFAIGATGLMVRRNPLVMFMCVELMLNAVNLTFVSLAARFGNEGDPVTGLPASNPLTGELIPRGIDGQTAVFFVLVVAAAEVVVGLGIVISILTRRPGATADDLAELKG